MKRLGVFTPQLGTVSETFVRKHVEDLAPDRTVVVARWSSHAMGGRWTTPCPTLFLDRWELRPTVRVLRRFGWPHERLWARTISNFLRRCNVDIVLGEYLDQFIEFVPILDSLRIPYIVQGHGIDLSAALRRPGMAERYLRYHTAQFILTRCDFHRERLMSLGLPLEKIKVNPGGVDVPDAAVERTPEAGMRFLAIGRMVSKKGPIYLLQAFRLCAERNAHVSLDYIGDGELLPAARQFVDAVGLGERVRLHGAAPNGTKERLLRECGIFVQHSVTDPQTGDEEGLPASIQEAMAHGMAVISTRHSGIPEMVDHGATGLLVDERDAAGMASAMARVSQTDDWRGFGLSGWEKARRLYSWSAERSRLLSYLSPDAAGVEAEAMSPA
jgi:glycosyltransferase involved in cell wall biosynthesis